MFKLNFKKIGMELVIVLIILFLILKITFFNEQIFVIFKIVFLLVYIFLLPGYFILELILEKEGTVLERTIIGTGIGICLISLFGYHLSYFGIHVKYLWFSLPVIFIIISILIKFYVEKLRKRK